MTTEQLEAPDRSKSTTVRVELGARGYDIVIGRGLVGDLGARMAEQFGSVRAAIVSDANVAALYMETVRQNMTSAGIDAVEIVVAPGEATKALAVLDDVVDQILSARLERGDVIVALGGGVVGDLAGFAAAITRRGMQFVQVPTTLLAQVDSSVGGKTAINSPQGKNLIGAFHQPGLVVADTALLDSLTARDFRSGYAEVAKYGLIDDADFFAWLEANWQAVEAGGSARDHAVAVSCRAKARIVAADEFEAGQRALLNLGHTFGHALEGATGYDGTVLHGEGVAIGMVMAHRFSTRLNLASVDDADRVEHHLRQVGLPTRLADIDAELPGSDGLMDWIAQDKKVKRGQLTFVLTQGIGSAFIADDVPDSEVRSFLDDEQSP